METGDRDICDPETLYSNLSRDMLNHELVPSLSPVSIQRQVRRTVPLPSTKKDIGFQLKSKVCKKLPPKNLIIALSIQLKITDESLKYHLQPIVCREVCITNVGCKWPTAILTISKPSLQDQSPRKDLNKRFLPRSGQTNYYHSMKAYTHRSQGRQKVWKSV